MRHLSALLYFELPHLGGIVLILSCFDSLDNSHLIEVEKLGCFANESRRIDRVLDESDTLNDILCDLSFLYWVATHIALQHHRSLESHKILFILVEVSFNLFGRVLATEAIGVVAIGEKDELDIHAFEQEQVNGLESSRDTGSIAIVHESDILGETLYNAYLIGS